MPRRNRSSSVGSPADSVHGHHTPSPSRPSPVIHPTPDQIDSCDTLATILLHSTDDAGRTFLHMIASSATSAGDVAMASLLLSRAGRIDAAILSALMNERKNKHSHLYQGGGGRHLKKLLLSKDRESGYTPLHHALLQGNLMQTLLLLRHASLSDLDDNGDTKATLRGGGGGGAYHPMQALEFDPVTSKASVPRILNEMVNATDNENLSALEMLCRSSSHLLSRCRARLLPSYVQSNLLRRRHHMLSFDEMDEEDLAQQRSRSRSNSFGLQDRTEGDYDENDSDEEEGGSNRNEFAALRTVSDRTQSTKSGGSGGSGGQIGSMEEFGCEILTFGKADHCALGVPHFASRRAAESTGEKGGRDVGGFGNSRPRRVEAFALGELARRLEGGGGDAALQRGSAVAVAAAAHHTLVVTRGGHLMAFGLGKGGRLGTGDENHRPLPTRVLGPLSHRRVVSVAAAENHSLCTTSDGGVYAWGSNRFGQLGIVSATQPQPTTSDGGGKAKATKQPSKSKSANKHLPSQQSTLQASSDQRCLPRRVEDLKQTFIVSVAAGDRHSVALSRRGEVFAWGDNRAGQLGMTSRGGYPTGGTKHLVDVNNNNSGGGGNSSSSRGFQRAHRVDALWSASPRRVAIAVAAAEKSTLVLTIPPRGGSGMREALPVNAVYSWGHGSHVPVRVNFPTQGTEEGGGGGGFSKASPTSSSLSRNVASEGYCISPTAIAAARHHNVAITADGRVYTWGLKKDPLGMTTKGTTTTTSSSCSSSMVIATPKLVTSMLPQNGGGFAVAVSASENHTGVITDTGDLYTWGSTYGKDVLGHEGVRWQPCPRKVPGVHRVVGLAAAKEHTVLLVGTAFPPLPATVVTTRSPECGPLVEEGNDTGKLVQSLEELAARRVAQYVDLYNVLPILITAERIHSVPLVEYCNQFVRMNLDGVLTWGKKVHMDTYLDEYLSERKRIAFDLDDERDESLHPLLYAMAMAGGGGLVRGGHAKTSNGTNWMEGWEALLRHLPVATLAKHGRVLSGPSKFGACVRRGDRAYSFRGDDIAEEVTGRRDSEAETGAGGARCSDRCLLMTTNMDLLTPIVVKSKLEALSKEVRSVKKKLNQIAEMQKSRAAAATGAAGNNKLVVSPLSSEQREKLARRPLLEADLAVLKPALERVERRHRELNAEVRVVEAKKISTNAKTKERALQKGEGGNKLPADQAIPSEKKKPEATTEPHDNDEVSVAAATTTAYRCDVCKIVCPDGNSYALHMTGRKHRNRVRQAEEDEKMETASSMMEMKRRQRMLAPCQTKDDDTSDASGEGVSTPKSKVSSPWNMGSATKNVDVDATATSSVQPRYKLPPPPSFPSPDKAKSNKGRNVASPSWTVPPPLTGGKKGMGNSASTKKVSSFQKILEEEEKRAARAHSIKSPSQASSGPAQKRTSMTPSVPSKSPSHWLQPMSPSTPTGGLFGARQGSPLLSPAAAASLSSTPPLSSPLMLSAFLDRPSTPQTKSPKPQKVKWGVVDPIETTTAAEGPTVPSSPVATAATTPKKKSLHEIQREEEDFKSRQNPMCGMDGTKWYVERRERAGSLGAIQEQEEKEREMRLLVDEQRRIEEQIARENLEREKKEEKKKRRSKKKKEGGGGRQKQRNRKRNAGGGSGGKGKGQHDEVQQHEERGGVDGKSGERSKETTKGDDGEDVARATSGEGECGKEQFRRKEQFR